LLGLVASAFTARLIRDLLYGASTLDWSIFVIVAALLSLVAAIACALPAWRASRLDPMQALRAE
jgi:ABC-type antimicrobial peptide transport system permease subunit